MAAASPEQGGKEVGLVDAEGDKFCVEWDPSSGETVASRERVLFLRLDL